MIGNDVRTNEVAEAMIEVVKSFECTHNGATEAVQPINNLCGYRLSRWNMDDEKSLWFQPDQLKKGVCNKFNAEETWSIRMGTSVGGKGEVK